MNRLSYCFLTTIVISFFIIGCSGNHDGAHHQSIYTGEEDAEIKALSEQEVGGYRNGLGIGLSKVAELNQYPGPKHVLELEQELKLSAEQRKQTENLFEDMKENAIEAGEAYIGTERELNIIFEKGNATSSKVDSLLQEIGELKASVRAVHVKAHIKMKNILNPQQVTLYDELRGYENDGEGGYQNHF